MLPPISLFVDLVRRQVRQPNMGLPMPRGKPNRGVELVRGAMEGMLPAESMDARPLAGNILGLAFGIPSSYDKLGGAMQAAPGAVSRLAREAQRNPEYMAGYGLSTILTPGPDDGGLDDFLRRVGQKPSGPLDDTIGRLAPWEKLDIPGERKPFAAKYGSKHLRAAERRVARREATVQRKLVEGYEGKATPAESGTVPGYDAPIPHDLPPDTPLGGVVRHNNRMYRRMHDGWSEVQNPFVGPDWAESPGDFALWAQKQDSQTLAYIVQKQDAPEDWMLSPEQRLQNIILPGSVPPQQPFKPQLDMRKQVALAELKRRGWRGDISDAEHLALEGPPGSLTKFSMDERGRMKNISPVWTREERGGEMLEQLFNENPDIADQVSMLGRATNQPNFALQPKAFQNDFNRILESHGPDHLLAMIVATGEINRKNAEIMIANAILPKLIAGKATTLEAVWFNLWSIMKRKGGK